MRTRTAVATKAEAAVAKKPQAVRLDRETILEASERILQREGLNALTVRRVGAELGADPTAFYRHFRNKDALVGELADRAFARVPRVDSNVGWREGLRQLATHAREIYEVHPDFAAVLARQPEEAPSLERLLEDTLYLLAQAGLEPADAARVCEVIENYVAGIGLFFAVAGETLDPDTEAASRRAYAALEPETFPHAVAAAPYLFGNRVESFEFGLELLLDAIESLARRRSG